MAAVPTIPPTAPQILDIVHAALHANQSEWVFLRELRVGTGRRNTSMQRLDAFALNCFPHQFMKRVCYEVKLSRADFLCELKHPLKRRIGMRFSNEFYFAAPAGLIDLDDVPSECGLIEAGFADPETFQRLLPRHNGFFNYEPESQAYCFTRVPAPWRDTPGPTWQLLASMLRNQRYTYEEKPHPGPVQEQLTLVAVSGE
jgi:hypothetical protein